MDDFSLIRPLEEASSQTPPAPDRETRAEAALARRQTRLARLVASHQQEAPTYSPSSGLLDAVDVALSLGRPLLLTGDPGTGKTLAAFWVTERLRLGDVLEFHVKSDSRAGDLLYTFDAVTWFRRANLAQGPVPKTQDIEPGPLGLAFGWNGALEKPRVVLVDEIDKAPRDFPNDLLRELDQMRFTVRETGREVTCPSDKRPIIVITSNSERRLPDPFLRRCVQHRIKLDVTDVVNILRVRLGSLRRAPGGDGDLGDAEKELFEVAAGLWQDVVSLPAGAGKRFSLDELWRWLALVTLNHSAPADLRVFAELLRKRDLKDRRLYTDTFLRAEDVATLIRKSGE